MHAALRFGFLRASRPRRLAGVLSFSSAPLLAPRRRRMWTSWYDPSLFCGAAWGCARATTRLPRLVRAALNPLALRPMQPSRSQWPIGIDTCLTCVVCMCVHMLLGIRLPQLVCRYINNSGRSCASVVASGAPGQLHCTKHTCGERGCQQPKSSQQAFCPSHQSS